MYETTHSVTASTSKTGDFPNSEFLERPQEEAEEDLTKLLGLETSGDNSAEEERSNNQLQQSSGEYARGESNTQEEEDPLPITIHSELTRFQEEVTMTYPFPKYNDEADAEAYVRAFLTTWQENHVSN